MASTASSPTAGNIGYEGTAITSPNTGMSDSTVSASTLPSTAIGERLIESAWYYRLDAFFWNERVNGIDLVNESGPISTLGYMHRSGQERFRLEVFGGTVAYDGNAMYTDGSMEAYHQSNGTDYFGGRAEYDLLIDPSWWEHFRIIAGIGTRFWFRDLHDGITPSGSYVAGYQETWWTFYPYIGLETKTSEPDKFHFFGSTRFGFTPMTYEHADIYDAAFQTCGVVLHPKCGVTAQAEVGVACRRFTLSGFLECMSWSESNEVRGYYQPTSTMFTAGGRFGYSF
jgi:hypothetical protein